MDEARQLCTRLLGAGALADEAAAHASCEECDRAHAAMLEASVCYRAWPAPEAPVRAAR